MSTFRIVVFVGTLASIWCSITLNTLDGDWPMVGAMLIALTVNARSFQRTYRREMRDSLMETR